MTGSGLSLPPRSWKQVKLSKPLRSVKQAPTVYKAQTRYATAPRKHIIWNLFYIRGYGIVVVVLV